MKKNMFKKIISLCLIVSMIFSLSACRGNVNTPQKPAENKYTSGKFVGVGNGLHGEIKVEVEVKDGIITNINVLEQQENAVLGKSAFEGISAAVIQKNSTDVDIVTGATYSSKGMIEAINNALKDGKVVLATKESAGGEVKEADISGSSI